MQTVTGQVVDLDLTGSADNSIISGIFCVVDKVGDIKIDIIKFCNFTIMSKGFSIDRSIIGGESTGVGDTVSGECCAVAFGARNGEITVVGDGSGNAEGSTIYFNIAAVVDILGCH